jgi:hypothetical protein
MKIAEYPQRKCRMPVAGDWQDYPCEVREYHPGPCATSSVARSVTAREAFEEANPEWEKQMKYDDPFTGPRP